MKGARCSRLAYLVTYLDENPADISILHHWPLKTLAVRSAFFEIGTHIHFGLVKCASVLHFAKGLPCI